MRFEKKHAVMVSKTNRVVCVLQFNFFKTLFWLENLFSIICMKYMIQRAKLIIFFLNFAVIFKAV